MGINQNQPNDRYNQQPTEANRDLNKTPASKQQPGNTPVEAEDEEA